MVDADAGFAAAQTAAVARLIARQAAAADLVISAAMHDWLEGAAPRTRRLEASFAQVSGGGRSWPSRKIGAHRPGARRDRVGEVRITRLHHELPVVGRRLCDLVENLLSGVLRAKGILRLTSNPSRAARCCRRPTRSEDTDLPCPVQSEIVIIGIGGASDADDMRKCLHACEARRSAAEASSGPLSARLSGAAVIPPRMPGGGRTPCRDAAP